MRTTNNHNSSSKRIQRQRVIYFTRHAQALHNVEEQKAVERAKAAGKGPSAQEVARKAVLNDKHLADAPLSRQGLEQARQTGSQLRLLHQLDTNRFPTPDIVLVSPLRRALQTATALYRGDDDNHHKARVPKIVALEALREKRTGFLADERRSVEILQREFPHVNFDDLLPPKQQDNNSSNKPAVGEDNAGLQIRCHNFFVTGSYLANLKAESIAIVTHKAWLRELHHVLEQCGDETTLLQGAPTSPTFANAEVRVTQCTWETTTSTKTATSQCRLASMESTPLEQVLQCAIAHAVQDWKTSQQPNGGHGRSLSENSQDSLQEQDSAPKEDNLVEYEAIPVM